VGIGSASSKRKRIWECGTGLAFGLASRERAALVKACAVLGGMLASSIRTVARRLWAPEVSTRIGGEGDDVLFYSGVGNKRINHEIPVYGYDKLRDRGVLGRRTYTWLRERESGERWKASEDGAGMTEKVK
jgi:hypothetical protein